MPTAQNQVTVQVVIPARNEQDSLGRCLGSLTSQQGVAFQITVVDDASTDRTHAIAESFPGVRVISAPEPPPGDSGKCNALIQGTMGAAAKWLLFTDADTFHYPGSLATAVAEAEKRGVDLLSYSPEQETGSWSERAVMPLVFADLMRVFPSDRVNDPAHPAAAANGQYLLIQREPYQALGGHKVVSTALLEDLELARLFKRSGRKIWFRQGAGLVRTRMYHDFRSVVEGWTKGLTLLFPRPLWLAALRALEFLAMVASPVVAASLLATRHYITSLGVLAAGGLVCGLWLRRTRRAGFPAMANFMSFFGLPLFSWLLLRSWRRSREGGAVTWKGRTYSYSATQQGPSTSIGGGSKVES
jgi:cellulose synthase/poly-beta-1,6-N-acetylglucosamine synthase-like glycosyltransferase